jgi:hypothetical protein
MHVDEELTNGGGPRRPENRERRRRWWRRRQAEGLQLSVEIPLEASGCSGDEYTRSMQKRNSGGRRRPSLQAVVTHSGDGTATTSEGQCTAWCGGVEVLRLRDDGGNKRNGHGLASQSPWWHWLIPMTPRRSRLSGRWRCSASVLAHRLLVTAALQTLDAGSTTARSPCFIGAEEAMPRRLQWTVESGDSRPLMSLVVTTVTCGLKGGNAWWGGALMGGERNGRRKKRTATVVGHQWP